MPEKLMAPFTDKGKQVSFKFSGDETGTEICNRRNSLGPMGTGYATSVSGTHSTACGHPKAFGRKAVTTVQARRWSAQLEEFRFPSRNSGIGQERGRSPRRRAGWR